jgi:hypothetical protein
LRLFIEAQAAICVPSTEKCSPDSNPRSSVIHEFGQELPRHVSLFVNTVGTTPARQRQAGRTKQGATAAT